VVRCVEIRYSSIYFHSSLSNSLTRSYFVIYFPFFLKTRLNIPAPVVKLICICWFSAGAQQSTLVSGLLSALILYLQLDEKPRYWGGLWLYGCSGSQYRGANEKLPGLHLVLALWTNSKKAQVEPGNFSCEMPIWDAMSRNNDQNLPLCWWTSNRRHHSSRHTRLPHDKQLLCSWPHATRAV